MSLRVFNTLNHRKETFIPIAPPEIGLYTCGPTVYDYAHLGNFRSYVAEDLIKRYLIYRGFKVTHVMNITDIDDKTIRKARELKSDLATVTQRYIDAFYEDIDTLNILRADIYPRATAHIPEMQEMVRNLRARGHAYSKDGSVYFSIASFPEYGVLANISPETLQSGHSVDSDEYDKENARDFVLWKGRREGEPSWPFELGDGRPGWHLECSAMSMKYLGNHFDIHMGGVDNIFPHHENELAQARCSTGEPFVNYWWHVQHLIVDEEKMSKSLGNFHTLRDLMSQGHDPMSIRYLLLSTHYRKLLNFTFSALEQANQSLKRIQDFLFSVKSKSVPEGNASSANGLILKAERKFQDQMDDDFNISGALGTFFEFIREAYLHLDTFNSGDIASILGLIKRINSVLGVIRMDEKLSISKDIETLIAERQEARNKKDFHRADEIRDQLLAKGIQLVDTPDGVQWKRITT